MISRKLTPFSKDFFGGSLRGNFFLTRITAPVEATEIFQMEES